MMNLIANNCAGAFTYKRFGIPYNNPFMWMLIDYNSMLYLISHWNTIKFHQISLPPAMQTDKVTITIDGHVDLNFIHMKFDPTIVDKQIREVDVYTNRPYQLAVETYINRLRRMMIVKNNPTFLISDDATPNVNTITPQNSISFISTLNQQHCPYNIIWATQHDMLIEQFPNIQLTIIHPHSQFVIDVADYIVHQSGIQFSNNTESVG